MDDGASEPSFTLKKKKEKKKKAVFPGITVFLHHLYSINRRLFNVKIKQRAVTSLNIYLLFLPGRRLLCKSEIPRLFYRNSWRLRKGVCVRLFVRARPPDYTQRVAAQI